MPKEITWRVNLRSAPAKVFQAVSTDAGRASFWAESAVERDGAIHFGFINGMSDQAHIISHEPDRLLRLRYMGSDVSIELTPDGRGGTDVLLIDRDTPDQWYQDVHAGWVSVLLALKAAVDHGVDLRNHDPLRSWDQGYADN